MAGVHGQQAGERLACPLPDLHAVDETDRLKQPVRRPGSCYGYVWRAMKVKLVVVGGTTKSTEVELRLPTIIGRGRDASITIPHALISRQHCEIVEADGKLLVRDLGSLNGTYIGKERIQEAVLEPGALLTVGTVTFRALYEIIDGSPAVTDASTSDSVDGRLDDTAGLSSAILSVPNPVPSDEPLDDETAKFESEVPLSQLLPRASTGTNDLNATLPATSGKTDSQDQPDGAPAVGDDPLREFFKKLK